MKKKLLYISPFLPQKSGISDYSEALVYGLKEYFEITILIEDYKLDNKNLYKEFKITNFNKNSLLTISYDYIIYNIGNNPYFHSYMYELILKYPGYVILHDYILYYLTIGYYMNKNNFYSKIYEIEGAYGLSLIKGSIKQGKNLLECKHLANKLPLNKEIINNSSGIIVHSEYSKKMIEDRFNNKRILKINMINMNKNNFISRIAINRLLKNKFGISEDDFVIASFGFIAETKQNHLVCDAVKRLSDVLRKKIYYIMVGNGEYINDFLCEHIIKTGFINREEYDAILLRSDLVANLRFPTMGETSISLIHAMSIGKACLVTNYAWFSELPDDTVIKIDSNKKDDVYNNIFKLLQKPHYLNELAEKAKKYVSDNHKLETISSMINDFINKL